jgi:enoyl-CoA hydratase/carnithine racemase
MDDVFVLTQKGHVALLTMNRPEKLNALTQDDLLAFGPICRALADDPGVRSVVITGAGRGFSSGADVQARRIPDGPDPFAVPVRFRGTELDFITPLLELHKPTIAAVNGIAVGAGLGIALSCDIRVSGESGAFLANFRDLGIAATDGVPYLLPRTIGVARALEMLYAGDPVNATDALAMGLVNHVYPDAELLTNALALAERFAAAAPVALQMTKTAVLNGLGRPWPDALAYQELAYLSTIAFGAADMAEAAAARREARPPEFHDAVPVVDSTS